MVSKIGPWLLLLALAATPAVAASTSPSLPNGASSMQETYQDWRVGCVEAQPKARCSMSQQRARQNGQRVLAIELSAGKDGNVTGSLVLPFGLELSSGAALQVDDGQAEAPLPFKTCLPAGCIVQLKFDQAMLGRLGEGKVLKVTVTAADNDQPVALSISLKGFGSALARVQALSR